MFRESVRKNARDCFEKKGFAGNRHFQGTANFGYLEAIKCHFEARNGKFGQILSRIQSYFIFCPLHFILLFHRTLLSNEMFGTRHNCNIRGLEIDILCQNNNFFTSREAAWSCVGVGSSVDFYFFGLGNIILVIYSIQMIKKFKALIEGQRKSGKPSFWIFSGHLWIYR